MTNATMSDPYEVLHLPRTATSVAVKVRQKKLLRGVHPDANPGATPEELAAYTAEAAEINAAADLLLDPARRAVLDHELQREDKRAGRATPAYGSTADTTAGPSPRYADPASSRSDGPASEPDPDAPHHFDWTPPTDEEMAANFRGRDWSQVPSGLRAFFTPRNFIPWTFDYTLRDTRGQWVTQSLLVLACLLWPANLTVFSRLSVLFTLFPLLAVAQSMASRRVAGTPLALVWRLIKLVFRLSLGPFGGVGRVLDGAKAAYHQAAAEPPQSK